MFNIYIHINLIDSIMQISPYLCLYYIYLLLTSMFWLSCPRFSPEPYSFVRRLTFWIKCLPEPWPNGAGFSRVSTALSESSSIHSDAPCLLTRDFPGAGLRPMPCSVLEPQGHREKATAEESQSLLQVTAAWSLSCHCLHQLSLYFHHVVAQFDISKVNSLNGNMLI